MLRRLACKPNTENEREKEWINERMNESMKEWMKNVLHTHKREPWIEYTIAQAIGFLILNFMWKHERQ